MSYRYAARLLLLLTAADRLAVGLYETCAQQTTWSGCYTNPSEMGKTDMDVIFNDGVCCHANSGYILTDTQ